MNEHLYSLIFNLQAEVKALRIIVEELKKEVENCKEGKK